VGLAALHGIEAIELVLAKSGMDKAADQAFDGFTSIPPGQLEVVLFFGGNLIGSAALIWAQFRTATLPWRVPVLNLAAVAADFTMPDGAPPAVKSAGMLLFATWSVALALAVRHPVQRRPLRRSIQA
jgi:hypothetical protein